MSVDGESWPLPRPHLVIGTQNPVGQLGTYPLVESQLDRFGLSTSIGYPDAEVETRWSSTAVAATPSTQLAPVADPARWQRAIEATAAVPGGHRGGRVRGDPGAVHPVGRHRPPRGQPPCGHLPDPRRPGLRRSQRARLCHAGQDVQAVAVACLAHRLVAEGGSGEGPALVARVIADTPVPRDRRYPVPSDDGRRYAACRPSTPPHRAGGRRVRRGGDPSRFGPGVVLAGASVGLLAMVVAALVSWRHSRRPSAAAGPPPE